MAVAANRQETARRGSVGRWAYEGRLIAQRFYQQNFTTRCGFGANEADVYYSESEVEVVSRVHLLRRSKVRYLQDRFVTYIETVGALLGYLKR